MPLSEQEQRQATGVTVALLDGTDRSQTEEELYNRAFYTASLHYDRHGDGFGPVTFSPYSHGMYSQEIADALDALQDLHPGLEGYTLTGDNPVYDAPDDIDTYVTDVPASWLGTIDTASSQLADIPRHSPHPTVDSLTDWVKQSDAFDRAAYGEPMDTALLEATPDFFDSR